MSARKQEFTGKEVTDAIRAACDALKVPQEMLDIEVLETGSTGIFGLIRKKAKIRVAVKEQGETGLDTRPEVTDTGEKSAEPEVAEVSEAAAGQEVEPRQQPVPVAEETLEDDEPEEDGQTDIDNDDDNDQADEDGDDEDDDASPEEDGEVSQEGLDLVRAELIRLVELMGFPSTVEVSGKGMSVNCSIRGEHEEELAGPEGKTLDAIQYLVRKIVARKTSERLRIAVNVGNFRERRLEELKVRAVELAKSVRETGKTQVLPALNPSERREIHMVLQEDKEVRSRSVGEGLFKKILIYKPGKGNRGGRRKPNPRNRRGRGNRSGGSSEE